MTLHELMLILWGLLMGWTLNLLFIIAMMWRRLTK